MSEESMRMLYKNNNADSWVKDISSIIGQPHAGKARRAKEEFYNGGGTTITPWEGMRNELGIMLIDFLTNNANVIVNLFEEDSKIIQVRKVLTLLVESSRFSESAGGAIPAELSQYQTTSYTHRQMFKIGASALGETIETPEQLENFAKMVSAIIIGGASTRDYYLMKIICDVCLSSNSSDIISMRFQNLSDEERASYRNEFFLSLNKNDQTPFYRYMDLATKLTYYTRNPIALVLVRSGTLCHLSLVPDRHGDFNVLDEKNNSGPASDFKFNMLTVHTLKSGIKLVELPADDEMNCTIEGRSSIDLTKNSIIGLHSLLENDTNEKYASPGCTELFDFGKDCSQKISYSNMIKKLNWVELLSEGIAGVFKNKNEIFRNNNTGKVFTTVANIFSALKKTKDKEKFISCANSLARPYCFEGNVSQWMKEADLSLEELTFSPLPPEFEGVIQYALADALNATGKYDIMGITSSRSENILLDAIVPDYVFDKNNYKLIDNTQRTNHMKKITNFTGWFRSNFVDFIDDTKVLLSLGYVIEDRNLKKGVTYKKLPVFVSDYTNEDVNASSFLKTEKGKEPTKLTIDDDIYRKELTRLVKIIDPTIQKIDFKKDNMTHEKLVDKLSNVKDYNDKEINAFVDRLKYENADIFVDEISRIFTISAINKINKDKPYNWTNPEYMKVFETMYFYFCKEIGFPYNENNSKIFRLPVIQSSYWTFIAFKNMTRTDETIVETDIPNSKMVKTSNSYGKGDDLYGVLQHLNETSATKIEKLLAMLYSELKINKGSNPSGEDIEENVFVKMTKVGICVPFNFVMLRFITLLTASCIAVLDGKVGKSSTSDVKIVLGIGPKTQKIDLSASMVLSNNVTHPQKLIPFDNAYSIQYLGGGGTKIMDLNNDANTKKNLERILNGTRSSIQENSKMGDIIAIPVPLSYNLPSYMRTNMRDVPSEPRKSPTKIMGNEKSYSFLSSKSDSEDGFLFHSKDTERCGYTSREFHIRNKSNKQSDYSCFGMDEFQSGWKKVLNMQGATFPHSNKK